MKNIRWGRAVIAVLYFTIQSFFEHQAYGAIVAVVYGTAEGVGGGDA